MHVAEKESNPRTPKKIDKKPPTIPNPLARKRIHLKREKQLNLEFSKTHQGKFEFGSCSCCICACAVEAAPPMPLRNLKLSILDTDRGEQGQQSEKERDN
jgi:hypothetical protein